MASRRLGSLSNSVFPLASDFLQRLSAAGIDVIVTCTYRSNEEQAELYAQGRTKPGKIVTNAKPGQSAHNATTLAGAPAAEALDVVPMRDGKPVWDAKDEIWQRVGRIGKDCGLVWAGDWVKFKEFPHFQNPNWRAPNV